MEPNKDILYIFNLGIIFIAAYYFIIILLQVMFCISQLAVSGLKVNRLDMYGEVSDETIY